VELYNLKNQTRMDIDKYTKGLKFNEDIDYER
jgi:hypothetical protein